MSYTTNQAHNACEHIREIKCRLYSLESAEGAVPADIWVQSIIKISCVFVIGIVILESVVTSTDLNNTSAPFYSLMVSVQSNITSGYTLASLTIMVVGAGAIIHYLGFM